MILTKNGEIKRKGNFIINDNSRKPPIFCFEPNSSRVFFNESNGFVEDIYCGCDYAMSSASSDVKPFIQDDVIRFNGEVCVFEKKGLSDAFWAIENDFTITAKVYFYNINEIVPVIIGSKNDIGTYYFSLQELNNKLRFVYYDRVSGALNILSSTESIDINVELDIIIVKKGTSLMMIFKNKIDKITLPLSYSLPANKTLYVGGTQVISGDTNVNQFTGYINYIYGYDYALIDPANYLDGSSLDNINFMSNSATAETYQSILFTNKKRGFADYSGVAVSSIINAIDNSPAPCIGNVQITNRDGFKSSGATNALLSVANDVKNEITIELQLNIETHSSTSETVDIGFFSLGVLDSGIKIDNSGNVILVKGGVQNNASTINTGRWYNLVFVSNLTSISVYINGYKAYSDSLSGGITLYGSSFGIKTNTASSVKFENLSVSYIEKYINSFISKLRNQ